MIWPTYIYVASSWRNNMQDAVVHVLRAAGVDCYDFKKPDETNRGFHWSDVSPDWKAGAGDGTMTRDAYLEAISHPVAIDGYYRDLEAMQKADAFVMVLPCGRSAHLELGWAIGRGVPCAILLDEPVTPELMYRLALDNPVSKICKNTMDLLAWVGVED